MNLDIVFWPELNSQKGLSAWQISRSDKKSFQFPSQILLERLMKEIFSRCEKKIDIVRRDQAESGNFFYIRMSVGIPANRRRAFVDALGKALSE